MVLCLAVVFTCKLCRDFPSQNDVAVCVQGGGGVEVGIQATHTQSRVFQLASLETRACAQALAGFFFFFRFSICCQPASESLKALCQLKAPLPVPPPPKVLRLLYSQHS